MDPLFPKLWTVLNFTVLTSTVLTFNVRSPASRVHRPGFRVQRPESSIQSPASNSCVQSPEISVCRFMACDCRVCGILLTLRPDIPFKNFFNIFWKWYIQTNKGVIYTEVSYFWISLQVFYKKLSLLSEIPTYWLITLAFRKIKKTLLQLSFFPLVVDILLRNATAVTKI